MEHGIRVAELSLSGLSGTEARAALAELGQRLESSPLSVSVAGRAFELRPERVGFQLDGAATADAALSVGNDEGGFLRARDWMRRWFVPETFGARVSVDRKRLSALFDEWEAIAVRDLPYAGGLSLRGEHWAVAAPRAGSRIDRAHAFAAITDALGRERRGSVALRLIHYVPDTRPEVWSSALARAERFCSDAVELVNADFAANLRLSRETLRSALRVRSASGADVAFDLAPDVIEPLLLPLRRAVEHPPRDAQFFIDERDQVSIVPSRNGTRLVTSDVVSALLQAAESSTRRGELPVQAAAAPAFSSEDARKLHIDKLVSKFTTRHPCCQPRVQNIHRIADLVNGALIEPGQTFSLNQAAGERTLHRGFVPAPSIQDGEMIDSVGGGVSQFATTFFNAMFYGGYEIIERQSHTYWFSRYPMGHEATLSWPKPDVIVRNDSDSGILVKTSYTDSSITVKLFGDNGGRSVKASVSPRRDIVPPEIEFVPNASLPTDEEKIKDPGMFGFSVVVGRDVRFSDGRSKHEERKVTYKSRVRRVEIHPCRIPEGEPAHTGERCPEPRPSDNPYAETR